MTKTKTLKWEQMTKEEAGWPRGYARHDVEADAYRAEYRGCVLLVGKGRQTGRYHVQLQRPGVKVFSRRETRRARDLATYFRVKPDETPNGIEVRWTRQEGWEAATLDEARREAMARANRSRPV